MSRALMDWPTPHALGRIRRRRVVATWLALAVVTLAASLVVVHGFDVVSQHADITQVVAGGSPLYRASCAACDSGFSVPLPDWRSFSIWALAMGAASVGWFARRSL